MKKLKKKIFEFEGNSIRNESSFYKEVEAKLTFNLGYKPGRNLDAFNDILWGGFGQYEYEEDIILQWNKFSTSERNLNSQFLNEVMSIINNHSNVELIKN